MATILIVDANPADRHSFITLLGNFGYRLLEANDGLQALETARAELPDLIITDILMPNMDGFTLVRRLRAEPLLQGVPVIFQTAKWALVVARTAAVPAYVETARANLLAGKAAGNLPDRRLVARDGIAGSKANVEYFTATLPGLAAQYIGDRPFGPALIDQLTTAGAAAGGAYASMAEFLASAYDPKDTADRYAAGEAEYAWRVANCLRDARTPAELFEYGAAQVAEYEARIFRVAEEVSAQAALGLAFGTDAEQSDGGSDTGIFERRDHCYPCCII